MEGRQYKSLLLETLVALMPLISLPFLADPTLLSRQIAYGLIIGIGLWVLHRQGQSFSLKGLTPLLLAWVLAYLLSLGTTLNIQEGLYTFSKISLYAAGIWILSLLFVNGLLHIQKIAVAVVLASFIGSAFLLAEIAGKLDSGIGLWQAKNLYQLNSLFGHKNLFSSFQLLCFPFYFVLFSQGKSKWFWLCVIAFVLALFSLALLQTKAVWLGILIGSTLCFIPALKIYFGHQKKLRTLVVLAYFLVLGAGIGALFIFPKTFTLILNNDTIRERTLLWDNTLQMIAEHPVMGVGAGNWQVWFPKYGLGNFMSTNYRVSDGYTTFQRPHNDLLWALSEGGIAAFLSYLALLCLPILICFRRLQKEIDPALQKQYLILLFAFVSYLVVALVDFPLERNEHQLLFALLWAYFFSLVRPEPKSKETFWTSRKSLVIPAVFWVLSLFVAFNRLPNEMHAKKVNQAQASGNWNLLLKEAAHINKQFYTLDNFSIPIAWYEGVAHFSLQENPKAFACFEEAYDQNPYQVHVINNMASMYEMQGNHPQALAFYDQLLAISPAQPDALLNKSAVLFNSGQQIEAMRCLYQFKYDESNTQFLQYLKGIGSWYFAEKAKTDPRYLVPAVTNGNDCPLYLKDFFRINQAQNRTFENLEPNLKP